MFQTGLWVPTPTPAAQLLVHAGPCVATPSQLSIAQLAALQPASTYYCTSDSWAEVPGQAGDLRRQKNKHQRPVYFLTSAASEHGSSTGKR